jgi:hypothetical protein
MKLSTFPTFLAFLTQAPCFPAPANNSWQGLDIPPHLRPARLGPPTVGPEADDLPGGPARFLHDGIRYTTGVGSRGGATTSRRLGPEGDPMPAPALSVSDMAVSAGKKPQGTLSTFRQQDVTRAWPQDDNLRDLVPVTSRQDRLIPIMDILGCAAAFQN